MQKTDDSSKARAYILTIGDELLLGEIIDTNRPYIAQQLLPLGVTVSGAETVGDEIDDISRAFHRAFSRADVVIATGGLGPTDDDLTCQALAVALGVSIELRPDVLEQIAARLRRPVEDLSSSNRKQAYVPRTAKTLKNDWGTAPGVHVYLPALPGGTRSYDREKHVFCVPGVPREMKGLLHERILPILRDSYRSEQTVAIHKLHAFGIPESVVGDRIKDLMKAGSNPDVGTRVKDGVVTVRLVARAENEDAARALLTPRTAEVRDALKLGYFGEGETTLSSAALNALIANKKTVAIAESCTAGMLCAALTESPGASDVLLEGVVVYSNDAKMRNCGVSADTLAAHGAVSVQTAAELAAGIRSRAETDIGISITGIAGPGGGSEQKPVGMVCFGIATAEGVQTIERRFSLTDREMIRERAMNTALYYLYLTARGERVGERIK